MVRAWAVGLMVLFALVSGRSAWAWEAHGHQVMGLTAAKLLAGTPTLQQVQRLLGNVSLADAGVWADCVKGVRREAGQDLAYTAVGRFPECAPFETAEGIAAMESYVRRNHRNCLGPGEECHRRYHYTDVALQREAYRLGLAGTQPHDVVQGILAASRVLAGQAAPAPFDLQDRREALLVLVHLVEDLHQPLHVGSVYLDADGRRIDPDHQPHDHANDTVGGNALGPRGDNLHRRWDFTARFADAPLLSQVEAAARRIPPASGPWQPWPERWASDTLDTARKSFTGLQFGPRADTGEANRPYNWPLTEPEGYRARMETLKLQSLARGAARLAQLLQALLP